MKKLIDLFRNQKFSLPDNISKLLFIQSEWNVIMGGFFSRISIPVKVEGSKLVIGVLDNIVMQELSFKKDEILKKLAGMDFKIKEIQFKIVNEGMFVFDNEKKEKKTYVDLSSFTYIFDNIANYDIKISFKKAFMEYIKYLKDNDIKV